MSCNLLFSPMWLTAFIFLCFSFSDFLLTIFSRVTLWFINDFFIYIFSIIFLVIALGLIIHLNLSESTSGIHYLNSSKICKIFSFIALFSLHFFCAIILYKLHLCVLEIQHYTFTIIIMYNVMSYTEAERKKENERLFVEFVILIFNLPFLVLFIYLSGFVL